jgi:uncharacterized protein YhaN
MLDRQDFKQIEIIINTALDAKFDEKLEPIKQRLDSIEIELTEIKAELAGLRKIESEDVVAAYKDIEVLSKRVAELENQVKKIQAAQN